MSAACQIKILEGFAMKLAPVLPPLACLRPSSLQPLPSPRFRGRRPRTRPDHRRAVGAEGRRSGDDRLCPRARTDRLLDV